MKVAIVGAGAVGRTLARLWAEAGHEVMLSSRHPDAIGEDAADIGAEAGAPADAVRWGETVLLAVNYVSVDEAARTIRAPAAGKVVIDATNPLRAVGDGTERVIGDDVLALDVMAERLPDARLVKAFTTMWTGYLEREAHRDGERAAVALAGDDADAKTIVEALIRDAGFEPVDLGAAAQSRPLDPPSPIWNQVLTAREVRERVDAMSGGAAIAGHSAAARSGSSQGTQHG